MAKHEVRFQSPERTLGTDSLDFHVRRDDAKLGRLKISKGGVEWIGKDKTYGHEMGWTELAELIAQHGKSTK